MKRRQLVGRVAVGSWTALTGCLASQETTEIPLIVVNRTQETKHVRVEGSTAANEVIFDHTFALVPGATDETQAIGTAVGRVHVGTEGIDDAWTEYAPDENCTTETHTAVPLRIEIDRDSISCVHVC